MKRLLLLLAIMGLSISVFSFMSPHVFADAKADVCSGVATVAGATCGTTNGPTVQSISRTVVNILSLFVGIVCVIMVIVGGFKYVTSGGDSTKVGNAKNTIIYALIGLAIVAIAQTLIRYVLSIVL